MIIITRDLRRGDAHPDLRCILHIQVWAFVGHSGGTVRGHVPPPHPAAATDPLPPESPSSTLYLHMLVLALLSLQSLRAITMFMYRSARRVFPPPHPTRFVAWDCCALLLLSVRDLLSCLAVGDGFRCDSTVES